MNQAPSPESVAKGIEKWRIRAELESCQTPVFPEPATAR